MQTTKQKYHNTIQRLILYKEHKKRAVILREEIAFAGPSVTAGYNLTPGGSGVSDSTGRLASGVGDKLAELREIEQEIRIIDMALDMLSAPKKLIIQTRFMTEYVQDKESFTTLRNHSRKYKWKVMHYRDYERLRDESIRDMAQMLGDNGNDLAIDRQ